MKYLVIVALVMLASVTVSAQTSTPTPTPTPSPTPDAISNSVSHQMATLQAVINATPVQYGDDDVDASLATSVAAAAQMISNAKGFLNAPNTFGSMWPLALFMIVALGVVITVKISVFTSPVIAALYGFTVRTVSFVRGLF